MIFGLNKKFGYIMFKVELFGVSLGLRCIPQKKVIYVYFFIIDIFLISNSLFDIKIVLLWSIFTI